MKYKERSEALEGVVKDIFWMARRYAHGRHTVAPDTVRSAYRTLVDLGIEINGDDTIKKPDSVDISSRMFRGDYLDDIS